MERKKKCVCIASNDNASYHIFYARGVSKQYILFVYRNIYIRILKIRK